MNLPRRLCSVMAASAMLHLHLHLLPPVLSWTYKLRQSLSQIRGHHQAFLQPDTVVVFHSFSKRGRRWEGLRVSLPLERGQDCGICLKIQYKSKSTFIELFIMVPHQKSCLVCQGSRALIIFKSSPETIWSIVMTACATLPSLNLAGRPLQKPCY